MRSGHSWLDVKSYTLSEIGFFVYACARDSKTEFNDRVTEIWFGNNLSEKGVKELYKSDKRGNKAVVTTEADLKRLASAIQGLT